MSKNNSKGNKKSSVINIDYASWLKINLRNFKLKM